jgi:hypothetical protein
MQPESDAGFHGVVPNDSATGGVYDEGVGLEVVAHLLHQAAFFAVATTFICCQS